MRIKGDALRLLRKKAKFTQEQLAHTLTMAVNTLKRAELGKKGVSMANADVIDAWVEKCFPGYGSLVDQLPAAPNANSSLARPADWNAYLRHVRDECRYFEVRGMVVGGNAIPRIPISNIYIPLPAVGGRDLQEGRVDGPYTFTLEAAAIKERLLLIVGDPGSGKSGFVLHSIARNLAEEAPGLFPIYIRVAELATHIRTATRNRDVPSVDARWLAHRLAAQSKALNWGLSADDFDRKMHEGTTVIYLNGLDEPADGAARAQVAEIVMEAAKTYEEARFVVTSRPEAPEFKALAVQPVNRGGEDRKSSFQMVRIGNLDRHARECFLRQWSRLVYKGDPDECDRHAAGLTAAVEARIEIRRLASNVMMLTMIALAYEDRDERTGQRERLPQRRADVYQRVLERLAKARPKKNGRPGADRCLELFGELALTMQCDPDDRRTISLGKAAAALAKWFRGAAPERRARRFLEAEAIDSGIVVMRGRKVQFPHLSFEEFLAARSCSAMETDKLIPLLFQSGRIHSPEWREVMLLLGGVLDNEEHRERLDDIFSAVLEEAKPITEDDDPLIEKARAVGLIGAMLLDMEPSDFKPSDHRYKQFRAEAYTVFQPGSEIIPLDARVAAAEALGPGDERLRYPWEDDYWVEIPAGNFWMGAQSEDSTRPDYDPDAEDGEKQAEMREVGRFWIGRFPVTVREYRKFLDETSAHGEGQAIEEPFDWDNQRSYPSRPVTGVNWDEAVEYCNWATGECGKKGRDWTAKLPDEEQWEFAARGTEGRKHPWGDEPTPYPDLANYSETGIGKPTPVGLFPLGRARGESGISDMAGSVWEWCADHNENDALKTLRGGCWSSYSGFLRAAVRPGYPHDGRSDGIGFRCVRELG